MFNRAYSRDNLPKIKKNECNVTNLDEKQSKGTYWAFLFID